MTERILVTGGAGYIGSIVAERLLEVGRTVVILDDLRTGHASAVPSGAEFVVGDVGDEAVLSELFAAMPIRAIVHLAGSALVAESVANPEKYRRNNVEAGRTLLHAAIRAGVDRLVFSSSCAIYGAPATTPILEDTPPAPINPYGESKLEFERLLAATARDAGFRSISLRYFNAAGASPLRGEHHDPETHLIPRVLDVALGRAPAVEIFGTDYPTPDGTAVRDYVHVLDLADAHLRALDAEFEGAVACNLGTGRGISVREVVDAARRVTGHRVPDVTKPRRSGDPPTLVAAPGRARALLSWEPRHSSLDHIVATAWHWHRAHPAGYPEPSRSTPRLAED